MHFQFCGEANMAVGSKDVQVEKTAIIIRKVIKHRKMGENKYAW